MQDNAQLPEMPNNSQYNLPELARDMHRHFPERTYKECHSFLDMLFHKVIPEKMHEGVAVIIHGFGTFWKHEDHVFPDPSTLDPNDRILKTKVHFRSSELLDTIADKDTI